mmetsp:Transcript_90950/g.166972  ORF Transcript_90950/g.166972 Transcript_90950/m.166972 type:complete len:368 (-) Transcript_90950:43-1146(-)
MATTGRARLIAAVAQADPVDGRGRRLVAERACRRGEVLLQEQPLLIWGPDAQASVAADGGVELELAGEELGNFDALAALLAFRALTPEAQDRLRCLDGKDGSSAHSARLAIQKLSDTSSDVISASRVSVDEYAEIAGIISANAAENSDGRRAVFNVLSMANHSCSPNAAWRTSNDATGEKELVCIAPKIAEGEEVCISYLPERELFLLTTDPRQARLEEARSFRCLCGRCIRTDESSKQKDSQLATLTEELLAGVPAATDKESAIQQCKDIGARLRRLDTLWPAASALKASLWSSYVDLLVSYGAPQALMIGAAQKALEESRPCLAAAAWRTQEQVLHRKLAAVCRAPRSQQEERVPAEPPATPALP